MRVRQPVKSLFGLTDEEVGPQPALGDDHPQEAMHFSAKLIAQDSYGMPVILLVASASIGQMSFLPINEPRVTASGASPVWAYFDSHCNGYAIKNTRTPLHELRLKAAWPRVAYSGAAPILRKTCE